MSSALFRRTATAASASARSFSTSSPRSIARISLVGNLADTPELHTTANGREIIKYALASNSGPKENRQTSWFRVSSFAPEGPRRDYLLSLPKGAMVFVEGEATMNTYQDANGQNRSNLNILQRTLEVIRRPTVPEQGE